MTRKKKTRKQLEKEKRSKAAKIQGDAKPRPGRK